MAYDHPDWKLELWRGGMDLHDFFGEDRIFETGLEAMANCVIGIIGDEHELADIDEYWTEDDGLVFPAALYILSCRSRKSYKYPWFNFDTILPDTTRPGDETVLSYFFGFEGGGGQHGSILAFHHHSDAGGNNILEFIAGTAKKRRILPLEFAIAKPVDWETQEYDWMIKVHRNLIHVARNYIPIAFVIPIGNHWDFAIAGPPYVIAGIGDYPSTLPAFHEWWAGARTVGGAAMAAAASIPSMFRVGDGVEIAPLNLVLYEWQTVNTLPNKVVNPDVTSHPFPTFGFSGKTINFMANEAGSLDVEVFKVFDESWRVMATIAVVANTLLTYDIASEEVMARIVFTPDVPPATIIVAEVNLR